MLRRSSWFALTGVLIIASAATVGSLAQQSKRRPKIPKLRNPTEGVVTSYPAGHAPWDKRWVQFGPLPSGKIGVIVHQEGQLPLEIILETTKDQELRAVRFATDDRGQLIEQPLRGRALRVWMTDEKSDVMLSTVPIKMRDIDKIPSPTDDP